MMEFDIQSDGIEWTENPRDLTDHEWEELRGMSRLDAIKRHRALTHSTLAAAIRCVDAIQPEG